MVMPKLKIEDLQPPNCTPGEFIKEALCKFKEDQGDLVTGGVYCIGLVDPTLLEGFLFCYELISRKLKEAEIFELSNEW